VLGDRAENFYKNIESLTPQDVNDALIYALSTPASVQVSNDIVAQDIQNQKQ